ncbi:2-oxo-4-hydroxy-4-carboxy-5-ureidoimidazoline decarboxylase [Streptomyces sp. TR06-5]|uniref:2-oxo-4-hydroxy-4-carboxy-5-ureidoimidazoline decarboxylase n=1 Tax=unclassified Streptomyces TaxID=2593676 RepID=UPI0039A3466A
MRLPFPRRETDLTLRSRAVPSPPPSPLHRFNTLGAPAAERLLLDCCGSRRWAQRLARHRPYPDAEVLLAAADEASYDLSAADIAEALATEAPYLPPTDGPGALAAHTALRAGHAAYAERFGHGFVVCLAEYGPEERTDQALAAIRARLAHDPDEERALAAEELRRLARERLARLVPASRSDVART